LECSTCVDGIDDLENQPIVLLILMYDVCDNS
jgi:hypothetical protein